MVRAVWCLMLAAVIFSPVIVGINVGGWPGEPTVSDAFIVAVPVTAGVASYLFLRLLRPVMVWSGEIEADQAKSVMVLFVFVWGFLTAAAWSAFPAFVRQEARQPFYLLLDEPAVQHHRDKNGRTWESHCAHHVTLRDIDLGKTEIFCADKLMRQPVKAPGPAVAVVRRSWAGRIVVAIEAP